VSAPFISVTGNVGGEPRTRVVADGIVVTDFRIAATPRKVDRSTGEWKDQPTLWFGVTCWRHVAENVAASVKKGDRIVVTGKLHAREWKNEQGEERTGLEIEAKTIGFDLSRGKVVQERTAPLAATSDPGLPPVDELADVLGEPEPSLDEMAA
jgi:single-strand DNA-binding protein